MQNLSFLKQMLVEAEGKTALAVLTKEQLKETIKNIVFHYSTNRGKKGVVVSMSIPAEQLAGDEDFSNIQREKLIFIDMCSGKKGTLWANGFRVIAIENTADLTELRIILENLFPPNDREGAGKKFLIFDSVSALSAYVDRSVVDKFMYLLNNKISFEGNTGIFLSVKGSAEEDIELMKQFCSKFYDFSEVVTMEVEKVI